jgi:hypothetical protein
VRQRDYRSFANHVIRRRQMKRGNREMFDEDEGYRIYIESPYGDTVSVKSIGVDIFSIENALVRALLAMGFHQSSIYEMFSEEQNDEDDKVYEAMKRAFDYGGNR